MRRVEFPGVADARALGNGAVEVVVSASMGPRVLSFARAGGANVFGEYPNELVATPTGTFHLMGGHRLWAAPELSDLTYAPDNAALTVEPRGDLGLRLIQPVDSAGLAKEMAVTLDAAGPGVTVVHRITNRRPAPLELAPWALSIMRGGGTALIPNEPYQSHDAALLPVRGMALWAYTDLGDGRYRFGPRYARLTSRPEMKEPTKIGFGVGPGWAAYATGPDLFVKRFGWRPEGRYPDGGCNCECYTAAAFFEVESLGPLVTLAPGESVEHVERWGLFPGVDAAADDGALDAALAPVKTFLAAP